MRVHAMYGIKSDWLGRGGLRLLAGGVSLHPSAPGKNGWALRLITTARAKRFDLLLVHRVDRLSRSVRGLAQTALTTTASMPPVPQERHA